MSRLRLTLLPVVLSICVPIYTHADSVTSILGAAADAGTCTRGELPALSFNGSVSRTTNETGMTGFVADYTTGNWSYATRTSGGVSYLIAGRLFPLTITSVGPLFPSTTEITSSTGVTTQGFEIVSLAGRLAGTGCGGPRCFRWLRFNDTLTTLTQNDTNTSLSLDVQGFAFRNNIGWHMNSNGVDEVLYRTVEAGAVTSTVNTGAGAPNGSRNAIAVNFDSQILVGAPPFPTGRFERWSQDAPPVFLGATVTSCTTELNSILVVRELGLLFTACNGRVNRAVLSTGIETHTQASGVSGEQRWNGLMYDPNFNRLYLATTGTGAIIIYRLDPANLTVLHTHVEVLANVNTNVVLNRAWIDPLHGRIFVGANLTTPGSIIGSWSYCVAS